jgi:gliding motility-associated lipoprotein GldB
MIKRGLLIFLLPLLAACSGSRLDVDVSAVKVDEVKIDRLEEDLFKVTAVTKELSQQLEKKYGNFYLGVQNIVSGNSVPDSMAINGLNMFVRDSAMREAYNDCEKVYPDLNWLQTDITDVFRHFKYYFPKHTQPRVVTYMSGFNYSILAQDSTIGIALEMYLGSDNKFYRMLQFPKYKTMSMGKEYLLSDFVRGWMTTEFPKGDDRGTFLNEIIYNGKLLYLVDALLPQQNDTIKIGYTQKEFDWCKQNEYNMWAYFVQKKVLYVSNPAEIIKYTGEGPFTSAFNKESPARVGIWIGWQIVRAYMNNHHEVSLEDLMNEKDAQKLLLNSRYKPSK